MPQMRQFEFLPRAFLMPCAALLLLSGAGLVAAEQGIEKVAPFERISLLLMVLVSEKACKSVVIDHEAFDRFLADNGITALQLSREGPYGTEIVYFRRRLRRQFWRHDAESCALALAMFGPEGIAVRGLLKRP
jgi:hypothetical protein